MSSPKWRSWPEAWLLAVLLAAAPSVARAEVWRVSPRGPLSSIQQALERAAVGDTVSVAAGDYRGDLVIRRPVTLRGDPGARILGSGTRDVVLVAGDDAALSGFEIRGSGSRMMDSDAGVKVLGSRVHVSDNVLADNLFGVYLKGCREALVEGNRITGRAGDDIGQRGAGVHFYDAHHNTVRRNRVSWVRDGVYFDHADSNQVEGNEFSHLRYGVHYMYCKDNRFVDNIFRDSIGGVAVMYTERVTFRGNQIYNNRDGYNAFGLLMKDCLDSVAYENAIVNNVHGILLDNSHRNRLERNLVARNDVGVVLYASALENAFSQNDFVDNLSTLRTIGKAKADWDYQGRGNYFSDYSGYDLDADGVGDVPHRLQDPFEYLTGNRPRLRLYLNSGIADALVVAEKSFPLIPSSDQEDRAPAMRPVSGVRLRAGRIGGLDSSAPWVGGGGVLLCLASMAVYWRLRA